MDPSITTTTTTNLNLSSSSPGGVISFDQILQTLINSVAVSSTEKPNHSRNNSASADSNSRIVFHVARPTTSREDHHKSKDDFMPTFWPNQKVKVKSRPASVACPPTERTKSSEVLKELDDNQEELGWMRVLEARSGSRYKKRKDPKIKFQRGISEDNESLMSDFPRSLFTAGSGSDATSIGWADDAIEGESTDTLARQWAQVEEVFHSDDGNKPEEMSDMIYEEVLLWRRAFNPRKSAKNKHKLVLSLQEQNQQHYWDCSPLSSLQVEYDGKETPLTMTPTAAPKNGIWSPASPQRLHKLPSFLEELPLPHSHVESWLENITSENQPDDLDSSPEEFQFGEQSSNSLPFITENLSILHLNTTDEFRTSSSPLPQEEQPSTADFMRKVQRPISSRYLNRSKLNLVNPSATTSNCKTNEDLSVSGDWNRSKFHHSANKRSSGSGSARFSASNWSRHGIQGSSISDNNSLENISEEDTNSFTNRRKCSSKPRQNFMSWLLFDENDENIDDKSNFTKS